MTEINNQVAVGKGDGTMGYFHGHMPVFQHAVRDLESFRMFTSQMIVSGTVKPKEIVETFGVPMILHSAVGPSNSGQGFGPQVVAAESVITQMVNCAAVGS